MKDRLDHSVAPMLVARCKRGISGTPRNCRYGFATSLLDERYPPLEFALRARRLRLAAGHRFVGYPRRWIGVLAVGGRRFSGWAHRGARVVLPRRTRPLAVEHSTRQRIDSHTTGHPFRKLIGEPSYLLAKDAIDGTLRGTRSQFEVATDLDGSLRYWPGLCVPDIDSQGDVTRASILMTDIATVRTPN